MKFLLIAFVVSQLVPTCNDKPPIVSKKYIVIGYSEGMDTTALNPNNYLVFNQAGENFPIVSVGVVLNIGSSEIPKDTKFALSSNKIMVPGDYLIYISNVKDKAGNLLSPNPDKIELFYKIKEVPK